MVFLKISQNAQKNNCVGVSVFEACNFTKKGFRHRCFLVNFAIFFTKHVFLWNTSGGCFCKNFSTKNFRMKCVYITIYMLHVLLSRTSVYLCMWGFQKEKNWKKVARSPKAAKKLKFLFKTCFSNKPFIIYKRIIYFSRCHWQYFRRR